MSSRSQELGQLSSEITNLRIHISTMTSKNDEPTLTKLTKPELKEFQDQVLELGKTYINTLMTK